MDEKKNSLLIVDDETSNIMVLTHILAADYTVYTVKDGRTAVKVAEKQLPDVILLDIIMPDMDGYEVIAELKKSDRTKNIPVIFITGLSNVEDEERGLSLGAADYITKPFSSAVVKLRVKNQINQINLTRQIIDTETAEKTSRQRSDFLSRMSHEMRTPMNAIMGMTALAKNASNTEKRDDMLEKINSASGQLLQLIDDVLDMSDIEDNKLRLNSSEFSFAVVIRDILNKVNPSVRKKQQSLTTDIDPSIPDSLIGDERRLTQVILNLLTNAIKFTPDGRSIQINAFVREVLEETLTMQVEVIDHGIGISSEQQEKLFIPFEQADGGVSRKYAGAGLGLPIANHIISLMGGEIWVESEIDKGSKFAFTFKTKLIIPEVMDGEPISLEGKTALLVEDVEINREIVMAMLEETGLQIICAENGQEAVDYFSSGPDEYDVILMDINMPVMDGIKATLSIRALEVSSERRIPIIAMTANVLMSEVEKYIEAGMTDHIGKPVDFSRLLGKLYYYMRENQ